MIARRRRLALLGLGGLGAATLALRPADHAAPHPSYFRAMARALQQAGICTPTVVLDYARMQQNLQRILQHIGGRQQLRVVAKSLPCLELLDSISAASGSQGLMVFSLAQLHTLAQGQRQLLLGKPLPVAAAAHYYDTARPSDFSPQRQLQWLIDTPQRLQQYAALARARRISLQVNFEIDVGLHRGGISSAASMAQMLQILQAEPLLRWSGLMGYDAHLAKLPDLPHLRAQAQQHARASYAAYAAQVRQHLGVQQTAHACFNAAGSPTYRLYQDAGVVNELSLGSAIVKPSDFDLPLLEDLLPAAFIASPVLKALPQFAMPDGVEWLGALAKAWDVNQRRGYFIYGGNWLADPVAPAGLQTSSLYGNSSNQQLLLGSGGQQLAVDDLVFFRPRQSEAVLQQFGPIAVYRDGAISALWSPFPASA